jgi:hypothetical protein
MTPSPFDAAETRPDKTCAHYDRIQPAGFVRALNDVARKLMAALRVPYNDRYSLLLKNGTDLKRFLKPCDIHMSPAGNEFLAEKDWSFFSRLLR